MKPVEFFGGMLIPKQEIRIARKANRDFVFQSLAEEKRSQGFGHDAPVAASTRFMRDHVVQEKTH